MKKPSPSLERLTARARHVEKLAERQAGAPLPHASSALAGKPLDIGRFLAGLPDGKTSDLIVQWQHAAERLADPELASEHDELKDFIRAVEAEWVRRAVSSDAEWHRQHADASERSLLKQMGYTVGIRRGEWRRVRLEILARVFEMRLPQLLPPSKMAEWGEPRSAQRLKKMADSIARLVRRAKRRGDEKLDTAVGEWEDDLQFLHDEYYARVFRFNWPRT